MKPTGALTIYRGATESRRNGMAWTQSAITARHFRDGKRRRLGDEAFIFQATADEEAVLALFDARQESEVVVDPTLITDIRHVLDIAEDRNSPPG